MTIMRIPVDDPRTVGMERALGVRTKPEHERFTTQPFPKNRPQCKSGQHDWGTPLPYAGQPIVVCRQCGAWVFKAVLDHTLGKHDPHKAFKERNFLFEQRQLLLRQKILNSMIRR